MVYLRSRRNARARNFACAILGMDDEEYNILIKEKRIIYKKYKKIE